MADSADIDAAISAKLLNDATLMALLPDGVYFDEGPANKTRFIIVSLASGTDVYQFGGPSYEDAVYLVKGVALSSTGVNMKTAAARIKTLLESGITITGYGLMVLQREERIRKTEVDQIDTSIRWQHWGGLYRLMASPS